MARMLPKEVELVSGCRGLPGGGGQSVKCFEQSNGLDKIIHFVNTVDHRSNTYMNLYFWMIKRAIQSFRTVLMPKCKANNGALVCIKNCHATCSLKASSHW